ncbi:4-hydroxybenzoyl-CoA thioesterase [Candidatus Thiomargarita nelsonii]|uniref:4-hydroxybenzoyl-CoA thioesterase n=1 Tax=Candidatus Thiomargarita nelsonii TaxID=1003181 RepID=A0A4E0QL47_9GAMM|nr:4-hydroxybenzoyl-CoA thioesterase [Candidatus Thiomargarita nelsonii]
MYYEWHHIITFEETNLVGNVYYANHIRWQGSCREMFLRDHAPQVLEQLNKDLVMVTTRVSCEYFNELFAFDEVIVRMRAGLVTESRVTMIFDYFRKQELIARGEQQIACMLKKNGTTVPTPVPKSLREALIPYLDS